MARADLGHFFQEGAESPFSGIFERSPVRILQHSKNASPSAVNSRYWDSGFFTGWREGRRGSGKVLERGWERTEGENE